MSVPLSIDIKTTGGAQAKSQLDQVGRSMQTVGQQAQKTGGFMDRLASTFTAKRAMIFSLSGIVASGVEAIGMFSLLGDSQKKVADITAELTQMQKEGKTGTKEYADASRELEGAQRALRFQLRLTVLSAFDLLPFTINFISSMVRMKAESLANAASNKVLAQSNQQLAATELEVAGAQTTHAASQRLVATSAAPLTAALAAQRVQLAAGVAPLTLLNTNLTKVPPAMGAATVSTNIFSKALQSMWLRVLGPVGLAIGALLIAVEAWKGNWMGFGDAVNAAGVQIGNIHPILKTTMELIAKVGESIHALLSFDLDRLGQIWGSGGLAPPVKTNKALEEAKKNLLEFQKAAADMFSKVAAGDRGEQRDFLKILGVTGNEKKDIKQALDAVEEIDKAIQSFHTGLQTMEQLDLLESLGLSDVKVDEIFDDIMSNVADNFRDAGKALEKEGIAVDIMEQFADQLDKASEMGKDKGMKALMAWIDKNPDFLPFLQKHVPQLAKDIEAMIGTAGGQVDISDIPAGDIIRNKLEEANKNTKIINEGKNFGARLLEGLEAAFTGESANKLGLAIRKNVILPIINIAKLWGAEIGAAISAAFAGFDFAASITSLNAAIGKGGDIIGNFIAGIFGFNSNQEMKVEVLKEIDNFFTNTLGFAFRVGWTNFTETLKSVFSIANITGAIFNVGGFINTVLVGLFGTAQDITTEAIKWFNTNIFDPITEQFDLIMQEIGTEMLSIASVIDSGVEWITTILEGIFGTFNDIVNAVGTWFDENIIQPIKTAWELLTGFINDIVNPKPKQGETDKGPIGNLLGGLIPQAFGDTGTNPLSVTLTIDKIDISSLQSDSQTAVNNIIQIFSQLVVSLQALWNQVGTDWSSAMNTFAINTQSGSNQSIATISAMVVSFQSMFATMGSNWSSAMNTMAANARSGVLQIASAFGALFSGLDSKFQEMVSNWESAMDDMVSAAQDAANEIESALHAIPDEEVVVHVRREGSFAQGGLMSAANGRVFTTHGPQTVVAGDNAGGRETVAFIPHNDPVPTLEKIAGVFGKQAFTAGFNGVGTGSSGFGGGDGVNIVIFLDGQRMRNEVVKGIIKGQAGYR